MHSSPNPNILRVSDKSCEWGDLSELETEGARAADRLRCQTGSRRAQSCQNGAQQLLQECHARRRLLRPTRDAVRGKFQ